MDAELSRYVAIGADQMRPGSRAAYGYALARRAALGEDAEADAAELARPAAATASAPATCTTSAASASPSRPASPAEALALLDAVPVAPEILGAAEPARLRSISHAAAGDHAAAHAADRYAFRLACQRIDRLRDGYLDGVAARLDAQETQRDEGRYGDESLTDPLTGLPNRRQLERYVTAMLERGERAAIGVCDLIGFTAVNVRHGRHCGDLVLQRIAGVLNRVMRRGRLRGPVRRRRVRGGAARRRRRPRPPRSPGGSPPPPTRKTGRSWCRARRSPWRRAGRRWAPTGVRSAPRSPRPPRIAPRRDDHHRAGRRHLVARLRTETGRHGAAGPRRRRRRGRADHPGHGRGLGAARRRPA